MKAVTRTLPNRGRNTAELTHLNDVVISLAKRYNITEREKVQFSARAINLFNQPEYVGGNLSGVAPVGQNGAGVDNFLRPQSGIFLQPSQAYSSNPRSVQLALKLILDRQSVVYSNS